ncbi:MAG: hypothetical protein JSV93_06070 [Candidatus Omnitrophota bacterium]|nr:MAG: hypothetical protein JSV93_06070 [Candidatus Omnitrophota bacterium]
MRKNFRIFILFLIIIFLFTQVSLAEERVGPIKARWRKFLRIFRKPPLKPERPPLEELTEEEILRRIKYMLETSPEIADFIPELKNMDLEELDKENLIKIHNRINIERIRIQTEKMQRQLEATRASERIRKLPQDYTAPAVPQTPRPRSSPPEVPTPPASPPRPSRR